VDARPCDRYRDLRHIFGFFLGLVLLLVFMWVRLDSGRRENLVQTAEQLGSGVSAAKCKQVLGPPTAVFEDRHALDAYLTRMRYERPDVSSQGAIWVYKAPDLILCIYFDRLNALWTTRQCRRVSN